MIIYPNIAKYNIAFSSCVVTKVLIGLFDDKEGGEHNLVGFMAISSLFAMQDDVFL